MRKHISTLLTVVLALAAFGGTASVATAKHGADDPAGHVRHTGADDNAKTRAHRHARHTRGADDRPGHVRHAGGADDGPNHR